MKSSTLLLLLFLSSFGIPALSQEKCKVLIPAISDSYVGKCKKGYAHGKGQAFGTDRYDGSFKKGLPNGKGTYIWSTGERYEGHWLDGQRDGVGIYTEKIDGHDSITTGVWKKGKYMGPVPERPQVIGSVSVEKFRFQRRGDGSKVLLELYLNGTTNADIESFSIVGSSGGEIRLGSAFGFEEVSFPFVCKVSYYTWNKFHTSRHYAKFEFEISEPGEWLVTIHNN